MITIRPVHEEEIPAVKQIIHRVAYNIFGFDGTLEESILYYEELGIHQDLEDVRAHYFNAVGTFLVAYTASRSSGPGRCEGWTMRPPNSNACGYWRPITGRASATVSSSN